MRYNIKKAKALSERGRRMALARWKAERARRESGMEERIREMAAVAVENLPRREGDPLGCLQWTDFSSGKIRRWVVRIGDRSDRLTMESPGGKPTASHGWTWILAKLRTKLSA